MEEKLKSEVYFTDPTARAGRSLLHKLSDLFAAAGGPEIFQAGERVAVKAHFGEEGNTTYLNPAFAHLLVNCLKELGAKPFLLDTNTLYRGKRHRPDDHLKTARGHGFSEESMGVPVIIAHEFAEVKGEGGLRIARAVLEADALLLVTHATGHVIFGYGGAIKNISMGLASPSGKQKMHSDLKPEVKGEKCVACGLCVKYCPANAISQEGKAAARIDPRACIGCGECVAVCPEEAIPPIWKTEPSRLAEKSAAFARAVLAGKKGKVLCCNFLLGVAPDCDCCDWSEPPFVPDLGILASRDILAVDQASIDLIQQSPLSPGSTVAEKVIEAWRTKISSAVKPDFSSLPRLPDKFQPLFGVDVSIFLEAAEKFGLGSRSYRLRKIE